MTLKANLHFHTKEDPQDTIPYTLQEGIDEAARLKFDVLAITLHDTYGYSEEAAHYAADRGILLIPGIEKTILGSHVVILHCDKTVEHIASFSALAAYKQAHPESFIMAPHPYYWIFSLQEKLEQHGDIFDAVEWSWYYSYRFHGANDHAREYARKNNKSFIATSDTHRLRYLDRSYALVETESKDTNSIIHALKRGAFNNMSKPSHLLRDILVDQICITIQDEVARIFGRKKLA